MAENDNIPLVLNRSVALVLSDLIYRMENKENKIHSVLDDSERHALLQLGAKLDPLLTEPMMENYNELLNEAKQELIEKYGKFKR